MPPKRKAPASASNAVNEPSQTRRRTRATATAEDPVEQPAELPARTTRGRANAEDAPAPKDQQPAKSVPGTSTTSRAARASARGRKAAGIVDAEVVKKPKPSVPKKRARAKKVEPEVEAEEDIRPEESVDHPEPPASTVPETFAPKKRGRTASKKIQEVKSIEVSRPKRARRAKSPVEVKEATDDKNRDGFQPPASPKAPPAKRGRRNAAPAPAPTETANAVTPRVSSPTEASAPSLQDHGEEESSDDELLLPPPQRRVLARPTTPTRGSGSRTGTPRLFMHSVEVTPRHLLNTTRRDLGSPGPRSSTHVPPLGTPRLPAAFPSTSASPGKRAPAPSSSRRRATRTPSPQLISLPLKSPSRSTRKAGVSLRSQQRETRVSQPPEALPRVLPPHLHPLLERQKRAILKSLQHPPEIDEIDIYGEDYPPTNTLAFEQLGDLLTGTVDRGEGNSCLLIGPSGSGKTQMVERAIAALPSQPIVIRLSGYAQHNDRLAIREIAWQLAQQTGRSFLPSEDEDGEEDGEESADPVPPKPVEDDQEEDENPFAEPEPAADSVANSSAVISLPPPAHLLALISMIPTLPRPTIIVLDGFELFAGHARQALLYCLLDAAQACRTVMGVGSGMAVVGVTARVDTINLLEKRVKSRFSGRMIRTACPAKIEHWVSLARAMLGAPIVDEGAAKDDDEEEWGGMWQQAVGDFVGDEEVVETLRETYVLTRDFQMFRRIMTCLTLELKPISPYPTLAKLEFAGSRQRCPSRYPGLHTLPYPALCLLIASVHAQTSGHDVFTFEMLYDAFKSQVRTSRSAPVQFEGGSIGMVRCSREVLFSAFERLIELRIFLPAAAASVGKEFALHRSAVERFTVKKAVETVGQLNLKKWFAKG